MPNFRKIFAERADSHGEKFCPLCGAILDDVKDKRGVIEFMDGWFWVCGECRGKLGKVFDCIRQASWGDHDIIPYYKRSRKATLRYLEMEYQITIKQHSKGERCK